jgi:hypothetical protein
MRVSTLHFHVALDHKDKRTSYDGISASFSVLPLFIFIWEEVEVNCL